MSVYFGTEKGPGTFYSIIATNRTGWDEGFSQPITDFYFLIPDLFLVSSAIILSMYGVIYTTSQRYRFPTLMGTTIWISIYTLFCTAVLLYNNPLQNGIIFYHSLIFDNLSFYIRMICCFGGVAALTIGNHYFQKESQNNFEYIICILLALFSMFILGSSFDFLSMYLAIELQSLSFYVCAASLRHSEFSTEAGLKYFILGAFSSGLLLFGISFIYGFTGIVNFSDCSLVTSTLSPSEKYESGSTASHSDVIAAFFYNDWLGWTPISVGYIFLAIGLLFKLAAAPFHMWSPDVYEGAPTPFTAFFAINGKSSILAVCVRIYSFLPTSDPVFFSPAGGKELNVVPPLSSLKTPSIFPTEKLPENFSYGKIEGRTSVGEIVGKGELTYEEIPSISQEAIAGTDFSFSDPLYIVFFCSIASMIIGCFAAISQKKIKRVLAYSSIAHVGFMLIGLCAPSIAGYQSILIYLFIYIIMNTAIFAIVLSTIHRTDTNELSYGTKYLTDFAFLSKTNWIVGGSFALFMFSLGAVPPTVGFYSKAFLFFSAIGNGLFLLSLIAIFTSVCSCFYYIRFCRIIYFSGYGKMTGTPVHYLRIRKENAYIAAICFFITTLGICWTAPLYYFTNKIAIDLLPYLY